MADDPPPRPPALPLHDVWLLEALLAVEADPERDPDAVRFTEISGRDVLARDLRVMDLTAITLAKESGVDILVFNMNKPGNLLRVLRGEPVGTLVHWNESAPISA